MKCNTKYGTEYISLGCRKPRDQLLVEFNQEGFHRRGGTRNGPKKGLPRIWTYRKKVGKALQARKHHEKGHTCLGMGGHIKEAMGKKTAQKEAKDRRGGVRPGRMRG